MMNFKKSAPLLIAILIIPLTIGTFCCGFMAITIWDANHIDKYGYPGYAAQIEKVTLTTALNHNIPLNDLTVFNQNTERIYCVVNLQGMLHTRMGAFVRIIWYHENEELTGHAISTESWSTVVVWLEPPPDKKFASGNYRIDIFVDAYFIQSIYFKIQPII